MRGKKWSKLWGCNTLDHFQCKPKSNILMPFNDWLVLMGMMGIGQSFSGDLILFRDNFVLGYEATSLKYVTTKCVKRNIACHNQPHDALCCLASGTVAIVTGSAELLWWDKPPPAPSPTSVSSPVRPQWLRGARDESRPNCGSPLGLERQWKSQLKRWDEEVVWCKWSLGWSHSEGK